MHYYIIGTAGHVDHGKTALVRALTGMDCDTHPQEKARGLTINPGFAYLPDGKGDFLSFVDLPGHNKFISNMIAGSMAIDYMLLLVAADDGIMPQTREHLMVCSLLGIRFGAVIISKCDLVGEDRLEELETEIRLFLKNSFLENAPLFRVSSKTGAGVEELKSHLLLAATAMDDGVLHSENMFFRMNVDRCFSISGKGWVMAGTAQGASLSANTELFLYPAGRKIRIRSIQRHTEEVAQTHDRERVAINVTGVRKEDIAGGDVLCSEELIPVSVFDAVLTWMKDPEAKLLQGCHRVEVNLGKSRQDAQMRVLFYDSERRKAYVQLTLHKMQYILRSDRFIVSDVSTREILAGAKVLDITPLIHKKKSESLYVDFEGMDSESFLDYFYVKIQRSASVLSLSDLSQLSGLMQDGLESALYGDSRFVLYEKFVFLRKDVRRYEEFLRDRYKDYQEHSPLSEWKLNHAQFFALGAAFRIQPVEEQNRLMKRLMSGVLLYEGNLQSVDGAVCPADLNFVLPEEASVILPQENEIPFLEMMVKQGSLRRVQKYYFRSDFLVTTEKMLLDYFQNTDNGLILSQLKEMLGLSRKQALALLEYYELEKFLIRIGDVRYLNKKGVSLLR